MSFRSISRTALLALATFGTISSCAPTPPYRTVSLEDLKDAEGWYHLPEFRYKGEIRNGQPNGAGIALYPTGVRVEAPFVNGVANGTGRIEVPEVGVYVGEMRSGKLIAGEVSFSNGEYYRGQLANWRPEGAGLLVRANDQRFSGAFRDGLPNGPGVAYDPATRRMTDGTFVNGQPDGRALVTTAGVPSVQDYQRGRDVTEATFLERTAALAMGPVDRQLAEAKRKAEEATRAADASSDEHRRLRTLATPAGVDNFNKACFCIRKASIRPDGTVSVGSEGCLTVEDRNAPRPSPEEVRLSEQRESARRRTCLDWAKDLNDPTMPARIEAIGSLFDRQAAVMNAAVAAQRRAEADRERLAADLRTKDARDRSERVRAAAAAIRAENDAQMRAAEEKRRRACAASGSNCCYCRIAGSGVKSAASCAPCQ